MARYLPPVQVLHPFQEHIAAAIAREAETVPELLLPFPHGFGKEAITAGALGRTLKPSEQALVIADKAILETWGRVLDDLTALEVAHYGTPQAVVADVVLVSVDLLRSRTDFERGRATEGDPSLHKDWDLVVTAWHRSLKNDKTKRSSASSLVASRAARSWRVVSSIYLPPEHYAEVGSLGRRILSLQEIGFDLDKIEMALMPDVAFVSPGTLSRPSALAGRTLA